MKRLYHYQVGFPSLLLDRINSMGVLRLTYSGHAMRACINDRYGPITRPPDYIYLSQVSIIEVEVVDGLLTKIVVRKSYDDTFDIVLAISVDKAQAAYGHGIVKTVWANHKNDKHKTLDASKYDKP